MLTWNLLHGRAAPGAGRDLFDEFAETIGGWEWNVALLQEVPPWWPPKLTERLGGSARSVLTSRNLGLPLRRVLAERWPDVIRSGGGGANAILVRGFAITDHRTLRLAWLPERRLMHAVRLSDGGGWVGNLHATAHEDRRAQGEAMAATRALLSWAQGEPAVLGGDFNVPALTLPGLTNFGRSGVDAVFAAAGWRAGGLPQTPARGTLSDHAPLLVTLAQTT